MPRFFFHLRNDLDVDDTEGQDLSGPEEARQLARKYAIDMAAASATEHQRINLRHRIEVADESGAVLFSVEFKDVLAVVD